MARRKLTLKREMLAESFVETGNDCEAYRRHYSTKGMSQRSIEVESSRILNLPDVSLRVRELIEQASKKSEVTRERIISRLAEFAWPEDGKDVKDRDSIKALELLGKRFALWIERHQQDGPGWEEVFKKLSPETQMRIVEELEKIEVPDVGAIH